MRLLKSISAGFFAMAATGHFSLTAAPAPLLTFYGMITDEFGWPYAGAVNVTLSANGNIVLNKNLQAAAGKNYNYIFRVPYDTGVVEYAQSSVTLGDTIEVVVTALNPGISGGAAATVLVDRTMTVVSPPGAVINLNLSGGKDSLGDGLPDALRFWIWQTLGLPGPFNPTNITASMDSDGDGVSNLNEFLAGTDPANPSDYLKLSLSQTGLWNDYGVCTAVSQLSWFSVPGKTYQLQQGVPADGKMVWSPLLFASTPTGDATNSYVIGIGNFMSVFVPSCYAYTVYRLSATSPPVGAFPVP